MSDDDAGRTVAELPGVLVSTTPAGSLRFRVVPATGEWHVDLPVVGACPAVPARLRAFAERVLAALDVGVTDDDIVLVAEGYTTIDAGIERYEGRWQLELIAFFDPEQDRIGTTDLGEPLYSNPVGASYLELYVDPVDPPILTRVLHALLAALP